MDKVHDSEYMRVRDNLILYWDRWASRIELGESIAVFWLQQFYGIDEVKARACLGQLAGEGLLAVSTQYSLGPRGRARVQELARGSVTLELILLLLYNTGRADLQTPDARNRAAAAFGFDTPLADGAQVGLLQLGYLDEHRQHTLTEQGRAAVDRAQAEVQQRLDAELQEALVDCFPTPTALKYAVEFGLRVKPNLILGDGSQGELVAQVMRWAKANGREQDLAAMARQYAPANPKLLAFHARLMYDQVCVAATEFMGDVYQLSMLARIHLNISLPEISARRDVFGAVSDLVAWAIRTGRADLLLDALLQEPIAPDFRHRFEAIKASVELFEYFPGEGYLEAPERIQAFYHCLLLDYSPEELARVVKYALGQELYAVAERSPFQATVYSLLAWTNEQGSFAKLAQAAAQDKPQSSSLQEFYKSYRLERLARGICAAYPSRDALAMMLDFDLSVDLNAVTSKPDLGGAVQEVLAWAGNQALIERFCAAAQAENPTNPVLKKEVAYYLAGTGQSLDMPVSSAGLSVVTAQAEASPMAGPGVGATDGPRHAMLHAALVAMTGSIDDLAILVGYGLGDDLHTLGGEGSLGVLAYRLICWAEASGRLDELAAAALRRVSANPEIQAYVECYPLPDQEIPQPELGRQRAELHSAILGVVEYQYDDLAMLVDYELGEDAYSLTREGSLHTQVYRLIRWAEQNDRLDELVAAALHFNPSNEQIQAYVEQYPLPHHEVPQSKLGRQRAALHHALVAAFDLPGLRLLVQRQLGNEHELVWRDSPRTFGYELIRWAEVNGRYADLVAAAVAEAPDHPAIQAYLAEYP